MYNLSALKIILILGKEFLSGYRSYKKTCKKLDIINSNNKKLTMKLDNVKLSEV